jgi:hypothetical protein
VTHKFAQFLALAVGALALSAVPAFADNPCPTGKDLNYYLNNFNLSTGAGCTVTADGVTLDFTDFNYNDSVSGGAPTIAASSIGVTETGAPDGPGLDFDPGASVTSGQSSDIKIGFTVTDESGLIGDIYIALNNVTTSGTGTTEYTEAYCTTGTESQCSEYVEAPITVDSTDVSLIGNPATGGPVSSLIITKDVDLIGGSAGSAATSDFTNEYSTVPEPRGVSLVLGLGLLAGFVFFKRRQAVQS